MNDNIFSGLITALITPFNDNNEIDFFSLEKILHNQIDSGVNALVIGGSTGEGSLLLYEEYISLLKYIIAFVKAKSNQHKIKIIAAASLPSTESTVNIAKKSWEIGAHGFMCAPPPYIKPTQQGIFEHFKAICEACPDFPIMLYNVPSRTQVALSDELIIKLSKIASISSIKEASGDIERPLRLHKAVKKDFSFLAGDDISALSYNIHGAVGCVSVAANIAPHLCHKLQVLWQEGEFIKARKLQESLFPLYKALFLETNPIGVKYAGSLLGLCSNNLRLPLTKATPETQKAIEIAIKNIFH